MVYKGYESTEELSVFEKDPDTQGMLILPPSLRTNVYVHHAVDIVLRRDCNLGSTRGWTHRETRVFHARMLTRVSLLGNRLRPRFRFIGLQETQQRNCDRTV